MNVFSHMNWFLRRFLHITTFVYLLLAQGLGFCASVLGQQNVSSGEQCNVSNRSIKKTLNRDNTLYLALERNEIGDGRWFSWMTKMENIGVKHAVARIEFKYLNDRLELSLAQMAFSKKYYDFLNDKNTLSWPNVSDRTLLRQALEIPAFIEATLLLRDLKVKPLSCGTLNINLLDDACLPARNEIPLVTECGRETSDSEFVETNAMFRGR